jgi:tetratricopeptide (TPR) repeat protein
MAHDDAHALEPLDEALKSYASPALIALKGRLLTKLNRFDDAYSVLSAGAAEAPKSAALHAAAAKAATQLIGQDPGAVKAAMAHAEAAFELAFDVPRVAGVMGEVYLAAGMPDRAAALAEPLTRRWPANQALIALLAVAWRMTGDRRYRDLCDYDQVVGASVIDTPRGWPNLSAFLMDLSTALQEIHDVPLDAFGMVRRDGVESMTNLNADRGEVIRAFYDALDAPAQAYASHLGRGRDALRRSNMGGARVMAGWTVKTRSSQFHGAHLHPEGWLSSAFYVELPAAVEKDRQGWIKFGEPAIPTIPKLAAEHWVKPEPGLFVLFPSYMWHGTEPFHGEGDRLVMSVDFLPSAPRR